MKANENTTQNRTEQNRTKGSELTHNQKTKTGEGKWRGLKNKNKKNK